MSTVDLQALRELLSEIVARHGDPEWIVRLGEITGDAPATFTFDIDSGVWFATAQVSASGDLFYEQLAFDGGRSVACDEYSALSHAELVEHLERIVTSQRARKTRQ